MSGVPRIVVGQHLWGSLAQILCALAFVTLSPHAFAADSVSPDPCNANPQPAYCRPDFSTPQGPGTGPAPNKTKSLGGSGGLITRAALTDAIRSVGRNGTIVINGDFDSTESSDTVISIPVTIRAGRGANGPHVPCGWRIRAGGTVRIAGLRFSASPITNACITVEQGSLAIAGTRFDPGREDASKISDSLVYIDVVGGDLTVGPRAKPPAPRPTATRAATPQPAEGDVAATPLPPPMSDGDFGLPVEMYGPQILDGAISTADPHGTGIRIGRDASARIENLKVSGMKTGLDLGGSVTIASTSALPVTLCNNIVGASVTASKSGGGLFDDQSVLTLSSASFTGNETAVEIAPSFAGNVTLADLAISGIPARDCHKGWQAPRHARPPGGVVLAKYNFSGEVHVVGGTISDTDAALTLMGAIDLNAPTPANPAPTIEITRNAVGVELAEAPVRGTVNQLRGLKFAGNFSHDLWVGRDAGGELELAVSSWSSSDVKRSVGVKGKPRFSRCNLATLDDARLKPLRKLCP